MIKDTVVIIETSIFTRQVQALLSDDEYHQLQMTLVLHPDKGSAIPGSGCLRKTRWSLAGRGKRRGVRIIYYWAVVQDKILMLFMYAKNEQDDLPPEQLKVLRKLIEEEYS
jgi:mRNA-degrading endonuclease RelE of RelBE toxin-antitoxin system